MTIMERKIAKMVTTSNDNKMEQQPPRKKAKETDGIPTRIVLHTASIVSDK